MIMTKVNKISLVLLAAIAVTFLLSCNKEENGFNGKNPIGFHCTDVQTKALVSGITDMYTGFEVYAHAAFSSTGSTYSFNRTVTNDGSAWDYENPEYWITGGAYTFRAYYPASLSAKVKEVSSTEYSIEGFELEPQYGGQTDILMASAARTTAETATLGTTVPLNFSHLLSCLDVKLAVETQSVEVEDEDGNKTNVIQNAIDADILAVAFTGTAQKADYVGGAWTNHSGNLSIGDNMDGVALTSSHQSMFADGLLVIPESLNAGDVSLYILADIALPDGVAMQKSWTLSVPAIDWMPGMRYTYTATLTAEFNIEFAEPSVERWYGDPLSGIVIIR